MKHLNLVIIMLASLIPGIAFSNSFQESMLFTARMNGQQETPSVNTQAQGITAVILNPTRDTLCITSSWTGLSGPATAAHIHIGMPGQPGPAIIDLTPFIGVNQLGATITGAQLTEQLISGLIGGHYYINVHTAAHPAGEIRGQLHLETAETYIARLNGTQETPSNTSIGSGLGIFRLSADSKVMHVTVLARGLSGPAMNAHLHEGAVGQPGPIVVDLAPFLTSGIYIHGLLDTTLIVDYGAFLTSLRAGNIYINLHTDSFPNGEIRGQLERDSTIGFEALMTVDQQIPAPIGFNGLGLAYFGMNAWSDTLRYDVIFTGLSSAPSSAHLHFASPGQPGPIKVDLTNDLVGSALSGQIADTSINNGLLRQMLHGDIYIDVHNPTNPAGQIRGQLVPFLRSGYSYVLDNGQAFPSVVVDSGYGSGFIAVDPDNYMAHYSFLYSGLTDSVLGANINYGTAGSVGTSLFNIGNAVNNNMASGFLYASDTTSPLTSTIAQSFYNDSAYINLITGANPTGELRGQILSGLVCNQFEPDTALSVTSLIDYNRELNVYPNPTGLDGRVTARYVSNVSSDAVLSVYDMLGKKIISQHVNALVGTNKFDVDLSTFATGVYTIRLMIGSNNYSQQITRQ